MQATLDHFSSFNFSETKNRKPTLRYKSCYRFCTVCHRWIPKEYDYCPYFLKTQLKIRPRNQKYKKRYNSKSWSLEKAERLFQRFIERGYSIDEALEFVEAISVFRIDPKIAGKGKA
jgi:hypothetical protein